MRYRRWMAPMIGLVAGVLLVGGAMTANAADRTITLDVTGKALGWGQYQIAYSARNDVLWVSSSEGNPPIQKSALLKVDPDTMTTIARYDAPLLTDGTTRREAIYGIGVDDAHNTVWATTTRENGVAVYSQADGKKLFSESGTIDHSRDVVVDEAADRAYVSANFGGLVAVYDTATYQRVGTISTSTDSRPMSLDLVGSGASAMLYTTDLLTGEIYAINPNTETVRSIETGGSGTSGIAVDSKRNRAYVTNQYDPTDVRVIDLSNGERLATIPADAALLNAHYDPVNDLVYAAVFGSNQVLVIDATTMKEVGTVQVGSQPNDVTTADGVAYVVDKSMGGAGWADQIWKITATVSSTPDPSETPTADPTDTPTTDPTDTPTTDPTDTPTTDPTDTPTTDPSGSANGSVEVSVSVPATGALTLSVAGDKADLGTAKLSSDLTELQASGSLPTVKVTDLRASNPGWSLTGQVTDLVNGTYKIDARQLGWTPKVTSTADGQTVTAGTAVSAGTGLAQAQVLASAPAGKGTGTAVLDAGLDLSAPSWARGGRYAGVLTITVA